MKKTSERIIEYIKQHGPTTAKVLASEFALTTMGVRQHLQSLEDDGMLVFEDKKAARGRPTRYWALTASTNKFFPDRHDDLTSQLIESVVTVFGDGGLEQLIAHREQQSYKQYSQRLQSHPDLAGKLNELAQIRTEEGYVANVEFDGQCYWLLENHCPICAAASGCLNFCRSELALFQSLLGDLASVSREEHIIEGARRCAYKLTPLTA
ncbi:MULTISPECIES: helix-turn-helix transcriptional regulator [Shewanella]|uniref:helix-turn-helix transcriptional regulator n=1 Tax=Shewanella TaxID=22 RepID=UPI0004902C07|nr:MULTISPECIES: metalloregulator ArsR/SmtB family transcription factor [Shewanella]QLE84435.1 transcriptional regulator [Shewanella sp. Scap07]